MNPRRTLSLFISLFLSSPLFAYSITIENQCGIPIALILEYEGGKINANIEGWKEVFHLPAKLRKIITHSQEVDIDSENHEHNFIITVNGIIYNGDARL